MNPSLAALSPTSTSHTHADSTLSRSLISTLLSLLPPSPSLTLSIGHGHGLLEAHLLSSHPSPNLLAIDIVQKQPQYLPEQNYIILNAGGTNAVYAEAVRAEVWIFVYPRDLQLVGRYLGMAGPGRVRRMVFVGPRMDVEGFGEGMKGEATWRREEVEGCGLKEYEACVVWRRDEVQGVCC
ncbi:MAG: hypothetical protein Q9181_002013 [Wetmoreana brouardii]